MEKRYSIIFSSLTGNTRKLADQIHKVLPAETCDYFGEAKGEDHLRRFFMLASGPIREMQTEIPLNSLRP